jgi:hypothetical protein
MIEAIAVAVEVSVAEILRQEIYNQLGAAAADEIVLEQSWMKLGLLLAAFKANEGWRPLGYPSLDAFMLELRDKYHRGRTQLWSYLTVAEKLGPVISTEALEQMGISKALELKRALVKADGKPLPDSVVAAALTSMTIKELRGQIGQAMNLPDDREPGTWFDFDGCFMTPDERKEFKEAVVITEKLLELSRATPDPIRRKAIFFAWLREFVGTHAAEVNGPTPGPPTVCRLLTTGGEAGEPDPGFGNE